MTKLQEQKTTIQELAKTDLEGRPFLHEQGNSVTRGFVHHMDVNEEGWTINLRDVEWLNKSIFKWQPDETETDYGGLHKQTWVRRFFESKNPDVDRGIEISWHGCFMFIGLKTRTPWQDNDWPDLDTEFLRPGPMTG